MNAIPLIDSIDEAYLRSLIDGQVPEGRNLDYKETLPTGTSGDKKEFLADVSSFANAAGGLLIYGMKEEGSLPIELCGVREADRDATILRLEQMIRTGVEPRIPGVGIEAVPLSSGGMSIVIRVPRSWAAPHMVSFEGSSKFWSRNSKGKYQLDVSEIRSAFLLSESAAARIRDFRIDRLAKLQTGEGPSPLNVKTMIVLHVVPIEAVTPGTPVDLSILTKSNNAFRPIYARRNWGHRYDFDGIIIEQHTDDGAVDSYLQVFRNGALEAVDTQILRANEGNGSLMEIPSVLYEEQILEALPRLLEIERKLGIQPPVFVTLTLLGVKGYSMATKQSLDGYRGEVIDRDLLALPEVMVEDFDVEPARLMKPAFDVLWNTCGFSGSRNYDAAGEFVGQR